VDKPRRPKIYLGQFGETLTERKEREERERPILEQMLKEALEG
jgi:hypothetical protein